MLSHVTRILALGLALGLATAAGAEEAKPTLPTTPAMTWPLKANASPVHVDGGPLGQVYVTGVASGLAYAQEHPIGDEDESRVDYTNASLFIQNTTGPVQFFAQVGTYSLPALGTAYVRGDKATDLYSWLPVAFIKLAPVDNFSIQVGKLPTLIGAEYTFTFENQNIQRGLLWNQENAVNRGIQVNYSTGPVAASLSVNDGFYSDHYSWLSGLVTYTINNENTVAFAGGGNLDESARSNSETPLLQNNSQIYNIIYTHTSGPWTVMPYIQYSYVPKNSSLGITDSSATLGEAVLVNYAFNEQISLPFRAEYIDSQGDGGTNLLYGPGSSAWSLTVTPTYQNGIFFARGEASYTKIEDGVSGSEFGRGNNKDSQARFLVEAGILF